jgi:hypothetical protein
MIVPPSPPAPDAPSPDGHPVLSDRSATALALGLLALFVLAFYHQLWWPDRILIKRDAVMTFLPIKQYMIDRLRAGGLPEWFPYDSMGRPFLGAAITGVFHPFTLLYFALPAPDALRLSTLLSCLLAAGGAFALGRHLGFSLAGAWLAGCAFAGSGYVASMTENIQYLYGACLIPLFLLAFDTALAGGAGWLVATAALWASVFLNGDLQTGYYLGFAALLWTVMRADVPKRAFFLLAAAAGLAALLAGIQLGPALSVYLQGNVRHSPFFQEYALQWSTHPLRLLTMAAWPIYMQSDAGDIMATFFGGPDMSPWAESLYLGMPVLGLAVLGAARRRELRVLAVLAALALVLALGRYGGLYETFRHVIPFWSAFRYPEKWMSFVSCSAAMLAGAGLDVLRKEPIRSTPWLLAAGACLAIGLLLNTATAQTLLAVLHGASMAMARDVADTGARAWLVSGAAAASIALLLVSAQRRLIEPRLLLAGLLAVVAMDLAAANTRAYFTAPRAAGEFTPPFARTLAEREGPLAPGRFRVASLHFGDRIGWPKPLEERIGYHGASATHFRQALNGGMNSEWGIEGFRPTLPGANPVIDAICYRLSTEELYARLNVAYFVGLRSKVTDQRLLDRLVMELPEYDLLLTRNPVPPQPRAYLSRKPEPVVTPPAAEKFFVRPDFLSGEVDLIETAGALPGPSAGGQARVERYEPERVVVRASAPAPAVLVLVDAFDPGWQATLDTGEALPILQANLLMRAVVVPAGEHRVTFAYRTPLLEAGAAASAAGFLFALALLGNAWRHRRRHGPP